MSVCQVHILLHSLKGTVKNGREPGVQHCTTLDFVICGMSDRMLGEGMNQANVRMNESRLNQRIGNNVPVQEQDVQSYSQLTHHQFFPTQYRYPSYQCSSL